MELRKLLKNAVIDAFEPKPFWDRMDKGLIKQIRHEKAKIEIAKIAKKYE